MLRLSWSPDGQYLVSAHAMNNSGPTAQIIERDGWKTNMDFVGHRKAVTVVVRARDQSIKCILLRSFYISTQRRAQCLGKNSMEGRNLQRNQAERGGQRQKPRKKPS